MKIFLTSFVLLSIIYGLSGHCVRHQPGKECHERIFDEPEPKDIHYIYHGESCDCPKYHDVTVQRPIVAEQRSSQATHEYAIAVPAQKQEEVSRYLFDVRVEKPVEKPRDRSSGSYRYDVHVPAKQQESSAVRYIFDSRVEKPVQPCAEKPWQGLVAQVDRISMPAPPRSCQNTEHSPQTCDCGCRDPSHTPGTCTCGNSDYKLPIIYNSRYDNQPDYSQNIPAFTFPDSMSMPSDYGVENLRMKRQLNVEKKPKSKRREIKFPKLKPLKKISPKSFKTVEPIVKPKSKSKKPDVVRRSRSSRRRNDVPCGYSYESCDPKKHNREGCPLCYKCKCEPITKPNENEKFSPFDIKVPYKFVTHDEAPGTAPTQQEFDYEPSSYTGLNDQDMYKKYIKQVVSKYPEHMARKMPDMQDQQRDLLKFIDQLAKSDKSAGSQIENEDVRYKMMDDAMNMYKYYERAVNVLPKTPLSPNDGKFFKKRGTVLEVIEIDPEDFSDGSYKIGAEDFGENISESQ